MPSLVLLLVIGGWQAFVTLAEVPHYIQPSPLRVTVTLLAYWPILRPALLITGRPTLLALILIWVIGGGDICNDEPAQSPLSVSLARARDTLDLVARAGLNLVSPPIRIIYMQDLHAARTARGPGTMGRP